MANFMAFDHGQIPDDEVDTLSLCIWISVIVRKKTLTNSSQIKKKQQQQQFQRMYMNNVIVFRLKRIHFKSDATFKCELLQHWHEKHRFDHFSLLLCIKMLITQQRQYIFVLAKVSVVII